jgi:hypothetical protein
MACYNGAGPTDSMTVYRRLVAVHRRLSPTLDVRERLHPGHNISIGLVSFYNVVRRTVLSIHGNKFMPINPPINIACITAIDLASCSSGCFCTPSCEVHSLRDLCFHLLPQEKICMEAAVSKADDTVGS